MKKKRKQRFVLRFSMMSATVRSATLSRLVKRCENSRKSMKNGPGKYEIGDILSEFGEIPNFRENVADLLGLDYPDDVYSSIVSSQFDADRLDYLRRDRMMTGTEQGGFDWTWLQNNIEIEYVFNYVSGISTPTMILGPKGLTAAEGYLLGRFHLYSQV